MMLSVDTDNLIAYTLEKMNSRLVANPLQDGQARNGLLFTGNTHDAIPRRLLLDPCLSPLDKMGWIMIRLYAQNNEGAIFPSYDELQLQLASPGKGKASRETVSRVLLMLRITGWLSLCKRVRDDKGRVRGNIYAQHDEPLTLRDAEMFDPRFLDVVTDACLSKNRTISQTARNVLENVKTDPTMRHYHSHLSMFEARLGHPQNASQMAACQRLALLYPGPGSESEPGTDRIKNSPDLPGSESEFSPKKTRIVQSTDSEVQSTDYEFSVNSDGYARVRNPNHYVRSITHCVKKNTYVDDRATDVLKSVVSKAEDQVMLISQLQALPEDQAQQILLGLQTMMARQQVMNPIGWMLAMMKKAREGTLKPVKYPAQQRQNQPHPEPGSRIFTASSWPTEDGAVSKEQVRSYVNKLREQLRQNTRQEL